MAVAAASRVIYCCLTLYGFGLHNIAMIRMRSALGIRPAGTFAEAEFRRVRSLTGEALHSCLLPFIEISISVSSSVENARYVAGIHEAPELHQSWSGIPPGINY